MELVGLMMAFCIGLLLALIGAGGSILTVPVLVYVFGIVPGQAITYSLFVVGTSASIAFLGNIKRSMLKLDIAFAFGLPSLVAVFLTRIIFLPSIPSTITQLFGLVITKNLFLLLLFAFLMLFSSFQMIRKKGQLLHFQGRSGNDISYALLSMMGIAVGMLTGLLGAGGGFLIIPSLVLIAGFSMKQAVTSSLLIISINSMAGFLMDFYAGVPISWNFLISFSSVAVAGIFAGTYLSKYIEGDSLKPFFGWFTLGLGTLIILKEIFIHV